MLQSVRLLRHLPDCREALGIGCGGPKSTVEGGTLAGPDASAGPFALPTRSPFIPVHAPCVPHRGRLGEHVHCGPTHDQPGAEGDLVDGQRQVVGPGGLDALILTIVGTTKSRPVSVG